MDRLQGKGTGVALCNGTLSLMSGSLGWITSLLILPNQVQRGGNPTPRSHRGMGSKEGIQHHSPKPEH